MLDISSDQEQQNRRRLTQFTQCDISFTFITLFQQFKKLLLFFLFFFYFLAIFSPCELNGTVVSEFVVSNIRFVDVHEIRNPYGAVLCETAGNAELPFRLLRPSPIIVKNFVN